MILEEVPEQWEYRRRLGEAESKTILNVFVTWELSFEQLSGDKESRDRKEHFLSLAAHFDNTCISQRYSEAYSNRNDMDWKQIFMTRGSWDELKYGDLVAECKKLSLLTLFHRQADGLQFSLHPVVRDWLKVRREQEDQKPYAEEFNDLLTCYLEGVEFDTLYPQVKQETLLHIDTCMQSDRVNIGRSHTFISEQQSNSASLFATYYRYSRRYNNTKRLYKRALAGREEKLGPGHPDTLRTVQSLAHIYRYKRFYDDAERLHKRVLAGNEERLGADHPGTLWTVRNFEEFLRARGRITDTNILSTRLGED